MFASSPPVASTIDFTLIGKSVLVVGGAYVLRALTELGVLSELAGILLAFVYALLWIWMSDRALMRGRRTVAFFDAGTAALIAGLLIVEASARFHALNASVSSAMIVVAALALLWVARRQRAETLAWIAALMASLSSIGLAIGTSDLVAPILAAAFVGAVISIDVLRMGLAIVSNCLAVPLIVMAAMGKVPHGIAIVESALIAFVVLWLSTVRAEAVLSTLVGLGGAALLAQFHEGHVVAVALACFAIAIVSYTIAFVRRSTLLSIAGALAAAIGSLLIIPPAALAVVCSAAMLGAAAVARRAIWPAMAVQAACWGVAAVTAGARSPAILLVVALVAAVAMWITPHSRLVLLVVASAAVILAVLASVPSTAIHRTTTLAIAAVVLSLLSRFLPEARTIAWGLLVLGGLKLLVDDLPAGHATTMVAALALYGSAMVIVARRRAIVTT